MPVEESELTEERLRSAIAGLQRELAVSGLADQEVSALKDWLLVATAFVNDGAHDEADVTIEHVVQEIRAIRARESGPEASFGG